MVISRLLPITKRSNPFLPSPFLQSCSLWEKQPPSLSPQAVKPCRGSCCPHRWGLLTANHVRQSWTRSDKESNETGARDSRGLFCLRSRVTVDSFIVINSLTSSFCDKWGRTDWTWWLIYQWTTSFLSNLAPTNNLYDLALPQERVYSLVQVWQWAFHHGEIHFGACHAPLPDLVVIPCASLSPPHELYMRRRNPLLPNLSFKWQ